MFSVASDNINFVNFYYLTDSLGTGSRHTASAPNFRDFGIPEPRHFFNCWARSDSVYIFPDRF